jgi:uncharacterized membrane protein
MKQYTPYLLLRLERKWVLNDSTTRSLIKTISWRLTGTGATFLISWTIAGNFAVAGTIATIQLFSNTILYFIHERIWNRVKWGRI